MNFIMEKYKHKENSPQNLNIAIINLLLSLIVLLNVIIIVAIIIISHIKDNLISLKMIGQRLGYIALHPNIV